MINQSRHKAKRSITITVSEVVYDHLAKGGEKSGFSVTGYATVLFEAAYAAKFGKDGSGHHETDQIVAATLMLNGSGIDFPAIAKTLGCSEDVVERIVGAWMAERTDR